MKPITLEFLKAKYACRGQVDLFTQTYGESVVPTLEACEAAAQQFNFKWFGYSCFKEAYEEAITPSRQAYKIATLPLWEVCEALRTSQWKIYQEGIAPHLKAYEEKRTPQWNVNGAAEKIHWEIYQVARESLWEAYITATEPLAKAYEEAAESFTKTLRLDEARIFFKLWSEQ